VFPISIFIGWESEPPPRKSSYGGIGSQTVASQTRLVGRLFSPLHAVREVVFYAVAGRAPIITLARPKSMQS